MRAEDGLRPDPADVFGDGPLRMPGPAEVEVLRQPGAAGEPARYCKTFLETPAGDFRPWTRREWQILQRLAATPAEASAAVPVARVAAFVEAPTPQGAACLQTFDAGISVHRWSLLAPLRSSDAPDAPELPAVRHVFEACAPWWALARHGLRALEALHARGAVHLDIKPENLCIPSRPAVDAATAGATRAAAATARVLDLEALTLIDLAFAVFTGEAPERALPLQQELRHDHQSPRLLDALEAGRRGDLLPTQQLDWRCDLFSFAALLWLYLPEEERAVGAGWTSERHTQAGVFVRRLLDEHNADLPERLPHAELIRLADAALDAPDLRRALQQGWRFETRRDVAAPDWAMPMTRLLASREAARPGPPPLLNTPRSDASGAPVSSAPVSRTTASRTPAESAPAPITPHASVPSPTLQSLSPTAQGPSAPAQGSSAGAPRMPAHETVSATGVASPLAEPSAAGPGSPRGPAPAAPTRPAGPLAEPAGPVPATGTPTVTAAAGAMPMPQPAREERAVALASGPVRSAPAQRSGPGAAALAPDGADATAAGSARAAMPAPAVADPGAEPVRARSDPAEGLNADAAGRAMTGRHAAPPIDARADRPRESRLAPEPSGSVSAPAPAPPPTLVEAAAAARVGEPPRETLAGRKPPEPLATEAKVAPLADTPREPLARQPSPPPLATEPAVPPLATEPAVPPLATEPAVPPLATEPTLPPLATQPTLPPLATKPVPPPTGEPVPPPTGEPMPPPTGEPLPPPTTEPLPPPMGEPLSPPSVLRPSAEPLADTTSPPSPGGEPPMSAPRRGSRRAWALAAGIAVVGLAVVAYGLLDPGSPGVPDSAATRRSTGAVVAEAPREGGAAASSAAEASPEVGAQASPAAPASVPAASPAPVAESSPAAGADAGQGAAPPDPRGPGLVEPGRPTVAPAVPAAPAAASREAEVARAAEAAARAFGWVEEPPTGASTANPSGAGPTTASPPAASTPGARPSPVDPSTAGRTPGSPATASPATASSSTAGDASTAPASAPVGASRERPAAPAAASEPAVEAAPPAAPPASNAVSVSPPVREMAAWADARLAPVLSLADATPTVPRPQAVRAALGTLRAAPDRPRTAFDVRLQEARRLNQAALRAYWDADDPARALALQLQAFAAHPLDSEIAGNLAFYRMRQATPQVRAARDMALHSLALPDARYPAGRVEDWTTLAITNALLGREDDARRAWVVSLAAASDRQRQRSAAVKARAIYGERLGPSVEAMLRRADAAEEAGTRSSRREGVGIEPTAGRSP